MPISVGLVDAVGVLGREIVLGVKHFLAYAASPRVKGDENEGVHSRKGNVLPTWSELFIKPNVVSSLHAVVAHEHHKVV